MSGGAGDHCPRQAQRPQRVAHRRVRGGGDRMKLHSMQTEYQAGEHGRRYGPSRDHRQLRRTETKKEIKAVAKETERELTRLFLPRRCTADCLRKTSRRFVARSNRKQDLTGRSFPGGSIQDFRTCRRYNNLADLGRGHSPRSSWFCTRSWTTSSQQSCPRSTVRASSTVYRRFCRTAPADRRCCRQTNALSCN